MCPIANALDVVRDLLFFGKVRYNELLDSAEGIPTNILADRLRRLEASGIVEKKAYQTRPARYEYRLTPRGADLMPILREMIAWANRHIAGTGKPPAGFFDRPGATRRRPRYALPPAARASSLSYFGRLLAPRARGRP